MYRLSVLLVSVIALSSCATAGGALFEAVSRADSDTRVQESLRPETPREEQNDAAPRTPPEQSDGEKGLWIETSPSNASVYVNGALVGESPKLVELGPGTHRLRITKSGYYPVTQWITYREGTRLEISVSLQRITGYLYVETRPANARIALDGSEIGPGVSELPVGRYSLMVRLFGYETVTQNIIIRERSTTTAKIELERASFRIRAAGLSRQILNPQNPGRLGETTIRYDVTTHGRGTVTIFNEAGNRVYQTQTGPFTTWTQSTTWDGRTDSGSTAPDGPYRIHIEGLARDDDSRDERELWLTVDSAAAISYRSLWSGVSGLLYSPTPEVLPPGSFQIGLIAAGHYNPETDSARVPAQLSGRVSPGKNAEIGLQSSLILGTSDAPPFSIGLSYKHRLRSAEDNGGPSAALYAKGTYLGRTGADTMTNYTGLSVGATAAVSLGPLTFTASPELILSPFRVTYTPSQGVAGFRAWVYGRAGVILDAKWFTAGVSAAARTLPFSEGAGLHPPYAVAAEASVLLPGTTVFVNGVVTAELTSPNNFYMMGGAGLTILQ